MTSLPYTTFGTTGILVSPFALGTGMLGLTREGAIDPALAQSLLSTYLNAGGNLIATSDAYGGGRSEELLSDLLGPTRDDVVLISKYSRTPDRSPAPARLGNHRKSMVQAVEGSLRRLRTDRLDLYLTHVDDLTTPAEEIVRGFEHLITSGKILFGGLSNSPAWRTAQAATIASLRGWSPLAAIEIEYHLLQRTAEREILPLAANLHLGVLGYSPLAAGMLTGAKPTADPRQASRMGLASEADLPAVLQTLHALAEELSAAPAHIALAWIVAKGVTPILGARSTAQLEDNLRAATLTLSADQLQRLDTASAFPLGYPQSLLAAFGQASSR